MEIVLANPRGFCAGVDRAIAIVNRALECFNPPIYVRHEVVHNKFVVDDLRQRGAVFVAGGGAAGLCSGADRFGAADGPGSGKRSAASVSACRLVSACAWSACLWEIPRHRL